MARNKPMTATSLPPLYTKPVKPVAVGPMVNPADPHIQELFQMHTYCRPAGSKAEEAFCARFLDVIPGMTIDDEGNRILNIPNSDGTPSSVLWSSHTDTVHTKSDKQRVLYGAGILSLSDKSMDSACLGADCTAGVWLMVQMIRRGVPGLYIFHSAEEIGGVGSRYIATKTPELLDGIDYAIAFDRRGYSSVITHQGGRCASDKFAKALAAQLSTKTNGFTTDSTGTFTDTANYTSLVPECTNLSVGYFNAHTPAEYLDVTFLVHLLERVCQLDFTMLPVARDPGADDFEYGSFSPWHDYDTKYGVSTSSRAADDLEELVYNNSYATALMLDELGITADELAAYIANIKVN